jgi:hypothetical protein
MNGFLVIGRCGMDDIPLQLCATREEALENARSVTGEDVLALAPVVMGVDVSVFVSVCILEFRDGKPREVEWVWGNDGDDGDDDDDDDDDAPVLPEDDGDDNALVLAGGGSDDDGLL